MYGSMSAKPQLACGTACFARIKSISFVFALIGSCWVVRCYIAITETMDGQAPNSHDEAKAQGDSGEIEKKQKGDSQGQGCQWPKTGYRRQAPQRNAAIS